MTGVHVFIIIYVDVSLFSGSSFCFLSQRQTEIKRIYIEKRGENAEKVWLYNAGWTRKSLFVSSLENGGGRPEPRNWYDVYGDC